MSAIIPYGVLINFFCIAAGGLLGALFKKHLSEEMHSALPVILGVCTMSVGILNIVKTQSMPPVVIAVIVGTVIGIQLRIGHSVTRTVGTACAKLCKDKISALDLDNLVNFTVLFCTSATGVLGAVEERLIGDRSILYIKSVLDFCTAMLMGANLGTVVAAISLPPLVVFSLCFFLAKPIAAFATPFVLANFAGCGGILLLCIGLRASGIKRVSTVEMLPALFLVFPLSLLWEKWMM